MTIKQEPFLRAPRSVVVFASLLLVVHIIRNLVSVETDEMLLINFAFIPAFFSSTTAGDFYPLQWFVSPFSYALMHAGWSHLLMNVLWLLAFGSPVAKRFGTLRFILFCLLAAPAGALAHFLSYGNSGLPMIGASAIISALTAAAVRFAFEPDGPLMNRANDRAVFNPAPSLIDNMRNRQALIFVVLWFALNFVFGAGATLVGPGMQIAWQAHIGGFIAGIILFALFDPVKKSLS